MSLSSRRHSDSAASQPGALDFTDERTALAALDTLLARRPIEDVLRDVVLPVVRDAAAGGREGACERASTLIRARLLELARGWGGGHGPRALLGTVPGDPHDLGLIAFGLVLRAGGWRVTYLGPRTPLATLVEAAELLRPPLVVLGASVEESAVRASGGLRELAAVSQLWLAGAAASAELAHDVGARLIDTDPVSAAMALRSGTGAAAPGR